jgi:hypothetical protein
MKWNELAVVKSFIVHAPAEINDSLTTTRHYRATGNPTELGRSPQRTLSLFVHVLKKISSLTPRRK